ncbi:MAG: ferrochelatase [Alphaproteobacteria bacterium]|nr:ferrochelatase [Alphaproteobacteria bacterium]
MRRHRLAIVLFNLGGPDRPEAVWPFLLNLFSDPAILRVPFFVRPLLARFVAGRRRRPATANYALLGGRSPLFELTERQARALEAALPDVDAHGFIAMRYWHPFSNETARAVRAWDPDEILLLPLYPQYSTTTTGSSLTAWREAAARAGLAKRTTTLCCWHSEPAYVAAVARLVRESIAKARDALGPAVSLRVLFSAHGLPEAIIRAGDPYQYQVEQTAQAVAGVLALQAAEWSICYQSRATPQKWLEPSTEHAIERAARDGVAIVVVPIAFVSEHSETLVELDVEYGGLARRLGIRGYFRVPAPNDDAAFIAALAGLARSAVNRGPGLCSYGAVCPLQHRDCPHLRAGPSP